MKLRFTWRAAQGPAAIADYILEQSPQAALRVALRYLSQVADYKNIIDKKKAPVKGPISLVMHHVMMMIMVVVVVVVHFAGAGD
jgi:hypothetical protein